MNLPVGCADNFAYCAVPGSGQDALLFGAVALLIACVLQGKLSALWVLIAGVRCNFRVLGFRAQVLRARGAHRRRGVKPTRSRVEGACSPPVGSCCGSAVFDVKYELGLAGRAGQGGLSSFHSFCPHLGASTTAVASGFVAQPHWIV